MTKTVSETRAERQRAEMVTFLCYLPPSCFQSINEAWVELGHGSRAELVRKILKEWVARHEKAKEKERNAG